MEYRMEPFRINNSVQGSKDYKLLHMRSKNAAAQNDAQQIIQFVREFQFLKREPTDMNLKRRAPLPEIGKVKSKASMTIELPNECFDKQDDSTDVTLDLCENELECHSQFIKPQESPGLSLTSCDTPYHTSFDHSMVSPKERSNRVTIKRRNSEPRLPRRATATMHHLPPLPPILTPRTFRSNPIATPRTFRRTDNASYEDIPERPSAPSPAITPPLPDDVIKEEPIDYIDEGY